MSGLHQVALRRLDAMELAIRDRAPWPIVEWHYDQMKAAVDRAFGIDRGRAVDALRRCTGCAAHGIHPHTDRGGRCLDCPLCVPAQSNRTEEPAHA